MPLEVLFCAVFDAAADAAEMALDLDDAAGAEDVEGFASSEDFEDGA